MRTALVLLLAAAACDPIATTDIPSLCEANPWGRPAYCPLSDGLGPTPAKCADLLESIGPDCDLTELEYIVCAAAMLDAPCNERPDECERVSKCLGN